MLDSEIDEIVLKKLKPIHEKLTHFQPIEQLCNEIPEQLMACQFIREDDRVLEFGGSLGRNSCVINTILEDKTNHVVVEPSLIEANQLLLNRDNNLLQFQVEFSAISETPLYSLGWYTFTDPLPNSTKVNVITYNELCEKYKIDFSVLVIDNEGNFVSMLKSFPNLLDGIRLVIIEHDFNTQEDLEYFTKTLHDNHFVNHTKYMKCNKYAPGMGWSDGLSTDPVFVSVWETVTPQISLKCPH